MASNRDRLSQLKIAITEAQSSLQSIEDTLAKHANLDSSLQEYKERAIAIQSSIETISESISEAEQSVLLDAENIRSSKAQVEKFEESIISSAKKVDEVCDSLFGELDTNGKRGGGLYSEIQGRIDEIDTRRSEQDAEYQKLFDKVESLLPGATSAGLAKTYADQKATYAKPELIWSLVTVAAMIGITILGYVTFLDAAGVNKITEALSLLVIRLPIFAGVT